jgi:ABC-type transport system involved in multi-copper enzyme maturation permease subunit
VRAFRLAVATARFELAGIRRQLPFVGLTILAALTFLATVSLFGLTGSEIPLGLVNEDHGPYAERLIRSLRGVRHAFDVRPMDAATAEAELRAGRLVAALTIPSGFGQGVARGETIPLDVQVDNLNLDLMADVQRALPSAILVFGEELGLPGLRVRLAEKDLVPRDVGFLQYVSVSALGLDAFILGVVLGAIVLAREWEERTGKVIRLAGAPMAPILAGKVAAASGVTALALTGATVLLVVGYRASPAEPLAATASLVLCTVAFTCAGAWIGSLFRRTLPIIPLAFALAVPLYIDCGALEPTRFDGERIWTLAHLSPLYYATGLLEWSFHRVRVTPEPIWVDAVVLAALGLACAVLAGRRLARLSLRTA